MVALRDALPCHEPNVRLLEPSPTITRCGAQVTPITPHRTQMRLPELEQSLNI
jgi:hypothetical protein